MNIDINRDSIKSYYALHKLLRKTKYQRILASVICCILNINFIIVTVIHLVSPFITLVLLIIHLAIFNRCYKSMIKYSKDIEEKMQSIVDSEIHCYNLEEIGVDISKETLDSIKTLVFVRLVSEILSNNDEESASKDNEHDDKE